MKKYNWEYLNESFFDDIEDDIIEDNIIDDYTDKVIYPSFNNCETPKDFASLIYEQSHIQEICDYIHENLKSLSANNTAKLKLNNIFNNKYSNVVTYNDNKDYNKLTIYIDDKLQMDLYGWRTINTGYFNCRFSSNISYQFEYDLEPLEIYIMGKDINYKFAILQFVTKYFNIFKLLNTSK